MKKTFVLLISLYQVLYAPLIKTITGKTGLCRYSPSCSEYTKQMIGKKGIIQGLRAGMVQLLHCHPLSKGGIYG